MTGITYGSWKLLFSKFLNPSSVPKMTLSVVQYILLGDRLFVFISLKLLKVKFKPLEACSIKVSLKIVNKNLA